MADKKAIAAVLALAIAAPAEGIRQFAYYDPPGILTVCRGHTGSDVVKNKKYSLAECDAYLTDDMRKAIDDVNRCAPGAPVEVLAAFGDAVFNIGQVVACDKTKSTAARKLAAQDWRGACNELPKWNKASVAGFKVELPGLTTRRNAERELCMEGVV